MQSVEGDCPIVVAGQATSGKLYSVIECIVQLGCMGESTKRRGCMLGHSSLGVSCVSVHLLSKTLTALL